MIPGESRKSVKVQRCVLCLVCFSGSLYSCGLNTYHPLGSLPVLEKCLAPKLVHSRDHSFPWNTEFWAEPRNLLISAEFLCFHGILRNSVLASDIGDKCGIFWWSSGRRTVCIHDFIMKYMTATPVLIGRTEEYWNWTYLKYCQLIWYLSVAVTGDKHCIFGGFRGHRKLMKINVENLPRWAAEFGKQARGIWKKFAAENCGP